MQIDNSIQSSTGSAILLLRSPTMLRVTPSVFRSPNRWKQASPLNKTPTFEVTQTEVIKEWKFFWWKQTNVVVVLGICLFFDIVMEIRLDFQSPIDAGLE